jgi:hypothetical protein
VLAAAAAWPRGEGSVLVGFDAPIGMSRSHWDVLQKRGAPGQHFAQWLDAVEDLEAFLTRSRNRETGGQTGPSFAWRQGPAA